MSYIMLIVCSVYSKKMPPTIYQMLQGQAKLSLLLMEVRTAILS